MEPPQLLLSKEGKLNCLSPLLTKEGLGVVHSRTHSMTQLNNFKYLKPTRKTLRNEPTPAEKRLWNKLRNSQLDGKKFRRQHSIGNYILDFYCPQQKLAIELDGNSHFTAAGIEYDAKRTEFLNNVGIQVLRFTNMEIFENLENVLEKIKNHP